MTDTNPEIGSGIPPRAAEVEPPAAVVHAGGSAESIRIRQEATAFMRHTALCGVIGGYDRCTCGMEAALHRLLQLELPADAQMGVTANAILLLGNVTSHIIGAPDRLYEVEQIDVGAGALLVRRRGTENIHQISIVQLEGSE